MKKKTPLLVIGSGGHFKSCVDIIEESKEYYIYGLISKYDRIGKKICGYQVLSQDDNYQNFFKKGVKNAFIAIGQLKDCNLRKKIFLKLKKNFFKLPIFISKNSSVSINSKISEGTIIHKHCHVGREVKIGKCSIINTASVVEHGCQIGNFCHISTSSTINGNVEIGDDSFIGSGSVLSNNIKIKNKSFIKISSTIIKSTK